MILIDIGIILFYYLLTIYLLFLWLEFSYEMNNIKDKYNDPILKYTLSNEEIKRIESIHIVLPSHLSESYKPLRFKLLYELERIS